MKISIAMCALPSRYAIGTVVYFYPDMWRLSPALADAMALRARIDKVQFSGSKVTYDLAMECVNSDIYGNVTDTYFYDAITVKDVDSTFVSTMDDIRSEWERTLRIQSQKAVDMIRVANRRISDLEQGIVIPDNWTLDENGVWRDPNEQLTGRQEDPVAEPEPEQIAAQASALESTRATFARLFAERKRNVLNGRPLVAWKDNSNGDT